MDCIGKRFKIAINKAVFDAKYFLCITNLDTNEHYATVRYDRNMPVNFIDENGVKYCDLRYGADVSDFSNKWFSTYAKKTKIGGVVYDANIFKCVKLDESNYESISAYSDTTYANKPIAWEQTKAYLIVELSATLNLYVNEVQADKIYYDGTEVNKVYFNDVLVYEN